LSLITVLTLVFTLHTITQANAASAQVGQLSRHIDQMQTIQLSQASYAEQRLNSISERLDTNTNRLEGRISVVEARQQIR